MANKDAGKSYSESVGGEGLDAPNPFEGGLGDTGGVEKDLFAGTPLEKRVPSITWEPKARVFVVDEEGNPEYEKILGLGANGKVVLGKKEVQELRGSTAYKVYLEWMVPVKAKKEGTTK